MSLGGNAKWVIMFVNTITFVNIWQVQPLYTMHMYMYVALQVEYENVFANIFIKLVK